MRSKILKYNLNLYEILKQARIFEGLSKHVNKVHENKQRSGYGFQKNKDKLE